jgi:hypothetical protein
LAAGNATIALHWVDGKPEASATAAASTAALDAAAAVAPAKKPDQAGVCPPSFFVADLASFHSRAKNIAGLTVVKAPSKQAWGGAQASYKDPDGLTLSVTELPNMRTA